MPLVTIILPIRNEALFIEKCLHTILAQDYPLERLEILAVDGMSNDSTRTIIAKMAQDTPQIRLLDNPQQITPTALNIGLRNTGGEIIIIVGGHCEIAPDYVSQCVRLLQERKVACVGGLLDTVGTGMIGEAISIAQSSPFGVGGVHFRNPEVQGERYVDTLAFGAYRADVFEKVGFFDEELVRNQDDEFNFRLTQAGGQILLSPRIKAAYYSRTSWSKLWKQYYQYGYWKVRVMQKRQGIAAWRHLVPGTFVLGLLVSLLLSLTTRKWSWFLLVIGPYLFANLIASLWTASRKGWQYFPFLSISFIILHWAYGLGFLDGVRQFIFLPKIPKI